MVSVVKLRRNLDIKRLRKRKKEPLVDFPFLCHRKSVAYLNKSKVLFIMRGLPGSGKSFVAKQIANLYKDSSIICSADHYFMNNNEYVRDKKFLGEAHRYCQETCKKAMLVGKKHVVVDNTNVQRFESLSYLTLAKQNGYVTLLVEPKTPWKFDVNLLASKNKHGCSLEYIESKKNQYVEILPMYWAFFMNEFDSNVVRRLAKSHFHECMNLFPSFAESFGTGSGDTSFYGTYYNIDSNKILHCTTCFVASTPCPYSSKKVVADSVGKHFELQFSGFIYTPRVAAMVINLKPSQLSLWDSEDYFSYHKDEHGVPIPSPASTPPTQNETATDDRGGNKEPDVNGKPAENRSSQSVELEMMESSDANSKLLLGLDRTDVQGGGGDDGDVIHMKKGSRAHSTIGCSKGVMNVQSGYELLSLRHLYKEGKFEQIVYRDNMTFLYYGDAAGCEVKFDWPLKVGSLFSGSYVNP